MLAGNICPGGKMENKRQRLHAIQEEIGETEYLNELSETDLDDLGLLLMEPQLYIEELLKIQTKSGEIAPFVFNRAQQKIYDEYMRQKKDGKPIRLIILKARQLGFTTWSSAMMFHACATTENMRAMIITHKSDASTKVLDKHRLFYEKLPMEFQPMRRASNAKEIIFENPSNVPKEKRESPGLRSRIEIETAVNKDIRGDTIHMLHMSELAFWPYPEQTMASALQAVPNLPGTVVIIESTANGVGDVFHKEWLRASRGESEFTPLFFPWYDEPQYAMPVPKDFQISEEEQRIKDTYHLQDEQIVWRRWCIRANCNGSEDIFRQEYPSNPNEAFLASGRPVFNVQLLERAFVQAVEPVLQGRLAEGEDGRLEFVSNYHGSLRIWQPPQEGHSYILGVDVAEGLEKGDYSVASVLDHNTKQFVAEWHGHIDADLFAAEIARLARWYNMAWVIPEINNHGIAVVSALRKDWHYGRIYRRRSASDGVKDVPSGRYGFLTSSKTKPQLIDNLAAYIRENWESLRNQAFISEAMSYCYDAKGKTNAQEGCYDDRVMAAALAVWGLKERPPEYLSTAFVPLSLSEMYGAVNRLTGY